MHDSRTLSGRSGREEWIIAATVTALESRRRTVRPGSDMAGGPSVRAAIDAFLDTPKIAGNPNTLRANAKVLTDSTRIDAR